jgi:hypothetical protein
MYVVRTNSMGDSLWSEVYGESGTQECNAAVMTPDGGFALAGHSGYEFWLVRIDSEGTLLWSRSYEGYEIHDIVQTLDGGFLLAGDIWSGGDAEWDGRIVRTDADGNELWSRTIDKDIDDHFYAVDQTPSGGYIIGGYTNAENGPDEVWLVRLANEAATIAVNTNGAVQPTIHWIAPVTGDYVIYSTTNPNHNKEEYLGPDWTWEATLPGVTAGSANWTDPGTLDERKYYIVVRSTL